MLATLALLGWVQTHLSFVKYAGSDKQFVLVIDVVNREIRRRPATRIMYPPADLAGVDLAGLYNMVMSYECR